MKQSFFISFNFSTSKIGSHLSLLFINGLKFAHICKEYSPDGISIRNPFMFLSISLLLNKTTGRELMLFVFKYSHTHSSAKSSTFISIFLSVCISFNCLIIRSVLQSLHLLSFIMVIVIFQRSFDSLSFNRENFILISK
jgi:hypothetical protein